MEANKWEDTVIKKKDCKYQPNGDKDELWADLGAVYQRIYLEGAKKQAEISFKTGEDKGKQEGIVELGKRLKQVREESYDEETFLTDLDELIDLSLEGKILPPIVVECIETLYKNPNFGKPSSKRG